MNLQKAPLPPALCVGNWSLAAVVVVLRLTFRQLSLSAARQGKVPPASPPHLGLSQNLNHDLPCAPGGLRARDGLRQRRGRHARTGAWKGMRCNSNIKGKREEEESGRGHSEEGRGPKSRLDSVMALGWASACSAASNSCREASFSPFKRLFRRLLARSLALTAPPRGTIGRWRGESGGRREEERSGRDSALTGRSLAPLQFSSVCSFARGRGRGRGRASHDLCASIPGYVTDSERSFPKGTGEFRLHICITNLLSLPLRRSVRDWIGSFRTTARSN